MPATSAGMTERWFKLGYVPIRSGACSLRSAATTDSAVMRQVLGFSDETLSIDN